MLAQNSITIKSDRAYFDQKIDLEDWLLPVVYQNQPQHLTPRDFTTQRRERLFEHKAEETRYAPPEPRYGFVGRDLDILQIEKRLLTKRNILLVRGMGGAGKTTLLQHLASWWQTDRLCRAGLLLWLRRESLDAPANHGCIAQHLYRPEILQRFPTAFARCAAGHALPDLRGSEPPADPGQPGIHYRSAPCHPAHAAARRTGGRCAVSWLILPEVTPWSCSARAAAKTGWPKAPSTTISTTYQAWTPKQPPPWPTASWNATQRHEISPGRGSEKLLKLLDGFPLALEVVLANLAHQTPSEVLAALQAGDVNIDPKSDSQAENREASCAASTTPTATSHLKRSNCCSAWLLSPR